MIKVETIGVVGRGVDFRELKSVGRGAARAATGTLSVRAAHSALEGRA